jgi:hypothetical protein
MRKRHGHRGSGGGGWGYGQSWHHGGHLHRDCNRHFSHDHRSGASVPSEQIAEEQAEVPVAHSTVMELVNIFAGEQLNHVSKGAQQSPKVPKPCIT